MGSTYSAIRGSGTETRGRSRSEEHTSELQSHSDLVCRLLLEKKKKKALTADREREAIPQPRHPTNQMQTLPQVRLSACGFCKQVIHVASQSYTLDCTPSFITF